MQAPPAAGGTPFVFELTIFVLAVFVGYHVVWRVTPALHSPLMSVTNAISSVIIVGALIAAGPYHLSFAKFAGFVAVTLAAVNIFGGFIVTQRMLQNVSEERNSRAAVSENLSAFFYLVASICFILALRGLSSPQTARAGNFYGIAGMVVAIVTTLLTPHVVSFWLIVIGILIGGAIGTYIALRIHMTALPQLVAAFHSLVGLAAVCVAVAAFSAPAEFRDRNTGRHRALQPCRDVDRHGDRGHYLYRLDRRFC